MIGEIIHGMPMAEYRAIPALSAGGAHLIERQCPAKYWHTSPFNSAAEKPESKNEFDIGSATHLLVLEPREFDASTVIIEADNYRGVIAQAMRDQARDDGKIPLLTKELATVRAMASAIAADPVAGRFRDAGDSEVVMTWTDPVFGIPCKLRVDHLPHNLVDLRDVKTATTAHPEDFERSAWDHGYVQRAAWYLDGVEAVRDKRPRFYWFIAVEKKPPFCVSVMKYTEQDLEWGRLLNTMAKVQFVECMAGHRWPSYRPRGAIKPRAFDIRIPPWARYKLQDLVEVGELPQPRSQAELERASLTNRLAAKLTAPTMDRDYMP